MNARPSSAPPQKTSLWLAREPDSRRFPPLSQNLTTDVVVVGGGIAGVSTAYFLTRAGAQVVLLEEGHLGTGETGFTTAFLTSSMDTPFFTLRERFGDSHTTLARQVGEEGITLVEEVVAGERLSPSFQRLDAIALGLQPGSEGHLDREATALRLAGADPTLLDAKEAQTLTGVPATGALKIPRQGAFDVRRYLLELGERIREKGGSIFEETRMTGIDLGEQVTVQTGQGTVMAGHVVLATGLFPPTYRAQNQLLRQLVTYVIALVRKDPTEQWGFPNVIAWDVVEPFHYLRYVDDFFLIGGEDRSLKEAAKAGEEPWQALERFAPSLELRVPWEVAYAWRGQILETPDGLPLVGTPPGADPRVSLVSGFGGNGMTLGSSAGKLVADLLTGVCTPADNPFRFDRATLLK